MQRVDILEHLSAAILLEKDRSITIIMFLKFERVQKLFASICCIGKLEKYFMMMKKI